MTKNKPILIGLVVAGVLILGFLINTFGNVGIRGNLSDDNQLGVPESLLPGVPFTLNWEAPEGSENDSVLVVVRSNDGRRELTATKFHAETVTAALSCETEAGDAIVQIEELSSGRILLRAASEILASGPDCLQ